MRKINLSHLSHDKYPLILSTSPVLSEAGLGQKNIQFSALLRLPGSANTLRREGSLRTAERPLERSSANKLRAVGRSPGRSACDSASRHPTRAEGEGFWHRKATKRENTY